MRRLAIASFTAAVLGFAAVARVASVAAAPVVGPLTAAPSGVLVKTPTDVVFTVTIADATPLPGGVNLLRTDPTGKTLSTVGVMHDDGLNGDAVAGDKTFSLRVPINEPAAGTTYYRVSAAFKGVLLRSLSPVLPLAVTAALVPQVQSVEATRTASASIGDLGGTVDATAADGTDFLLTLPPGALTDPTTITITPVISFTGLPLTGGGVFSVKLEPSGLHLARPATLTVTLPPGVSLASLKGFLVNDDGTGFELLTLTEVVGAVSMDIAHFSAGGAAGTTAADFVAAFQPVIDAMKLLPTLPPTQVASLVSSLVAWLQPPLGGQADFSLCQQTTICQQVLDFAAQTLTANKTQQCAAALSLAQAGDPFLARDTLASTLKIMTSLIQLQDLADQSGVTGFDQTLDLSCIATDLHAIVDAAKTQALAQPRAGILVLFVDLIGDAAQLGLDAEQGYGESQLFDTINQLIGNANTTCLSHPDAGEILLTLLHDAFPTTFLNGLDSGLAARLSDAFAGCRVRVSPNPAAVQTGKTLSFLGFVDGLNPSSVTWSMGSPNGGSTIDPTSGLFTASQTAGALSVIATRTGDATRFRRVSVSVVHVDVTPSPATVLAGFQVSFTATVTGAANSVTWSTTGGGSLVPTGPTTATYTAGTLAGTFQVTATDASGVASATADVTVSVVQENFRSFVWSGFLVGTLEVTPATAAFCVSDFTRAQESSTIILDPAHSTATTMNIASRSFAGPPILIGPTTDGLSFSADNSLQNAQFGSTDPVNNDTLTVSGFVDAQHHYHISSGHLRAVIGGGECFGSIEFTIARNYTFTGLSGVLSDATPPPVTSRPASAEEPGALSALALGGVLLVRGARGRGRRFGASGDLR